MVNLNELKDKKHPNDVVVPTKAPDLIVRIEKAKTVEELKVVLLEIVKRLG